MGSLNVSRDNSKPLAQELLTARMDFNAALYESRHLPQPEQLEILRLLKDATAAIRRCTQQGTTGGPDNS